MPEDTFRPPDRRPGPFTPGWWKGHAYSGAPGPKCRCRGKDYHGCPVHDTPAIESVPYAPYIEYRGRVLWHHLSDAYMVAVERGRQHGIRHKLSPRRVPGWDHPLWWVHVSDRQREVHFTRTGEHWADECSGVGCLGLRG